MTYIDSLYGEKKEKEDLSALRIALMQQFNDLKDKQKITKKDKVAVKLTENT